MKLQLTTKEAAEKLGVTPRRVRALIGAGRLPSRQVGRDHLIRVEDLNLVRYRVRGRPSKSAPPLPRTLKDSYGSAEELTGEIILLIEAYGERHRRLRLRDVKKALKVALFTVSIRGYWAFYKKSVE